MTKRVVTKCGREAFQYQCNKSWNELSALPGSKDVRFCLSCMQRVHFIDNDEAFMRAVTQKLCIAIDVDGPEKNGPMLSIGIPSSPYGSS